MTDDGAKTTHDGRLIRAALIATASRYSNGGQ